jgi:hypothetical protein
MLAGSHFRTSIATILRYAAIPFVLFLIVAYQWRLNYLPQTYYDHTRNAPSPEAAVREIVSQSKQLQQPAAPVFYGRYETEIGPAIFYSPIPLRYDLFTPLSKNLQLSVRGRPGHRFCYAIPQPDNRGWKLSITDQNCVDAYRDEPSPYVHCTTFPDFDAHIFVLFGRVNTSLVSDVEFHFDTDEIVNAPLTNGFFLVFPKRGGFVSVSEFERTFATSVARDHEASDIYSPPNGQLVVRSHAAQVILQQSIKDLCNH